MRNEASFLQDILTASGKIDVRVVRRMHLFGLKGAVVWYELQSLVAKSATRVSQNSTTNLVM